MFKLEKFLSYKAKTCMKSLDISKPRTKINCVNKILSEWVNPLKLYIRISDCRVSSVVETDLPAVSIHPPKRSSHLLLFEWRGEGRRTFVPFFALYSFSVQRVCTV